MRKTFCLVVFWILMLLSACGETPTSAVTNIISTPTVTLHSATATSLPPIATATHTSTPIPPTPMPTPLGGSWGGRLLTKSNESTLGYISHDLLIQPTGSGQIIPLAQGNKGLWLQSISPDGKKALLLIDDTPTHWAFGEFSSSRKANLFTLSLEDGLLSNLTDTDGADAYPSWSPDGQAVAFTQRVGNGGGNIMRINIDGSGLTKLTRDGLSIAPEWSPDGQTIAFIRRYSYTKSHLYLMAVDGSGEKQLTSGDGVDGWMENMAWSPDGQYLAFSRAVFDPRYNGPVSGAMYLLHILTGELTKVDNQLSKLPIWSPDGKKLAYSSGDYCVPCDNSLEIFDLPTRTKTVLLEYKDQSFDNIGWSPDGRMIQYAAWTWKTGSDNRPYATRVIDANSGEEIEYFDEIRFFYWLPQPINRKTTVTDCSIGVSMLTAGGQATLATDRPTNPLRAFPGRRSFQITEVKQGMVVQLVARACAPERIYWLVTLPDGTQGWTAEGDGKVSWLIPYTGQTLQPTPAFESGNTPDCAAGWTRLNIGMYAIVSQGAPNRVRSEPSKSADIIGQLYPGTAAFVIDGPVCVDGLVYWKVEHSTITGGAGWTAEGDGKEYWLEPMK